MTSVIEISEVLEAAAKLVDRPGEKVDSEFERGVVALATALCMNMDEEVWHQDHLEVMRYAVYGVKRPCPYPDGCTKDKELQKAADPIEGRRG